MTLLVNERSPGNLPDRLITSFEDTTGVALFYYVGHGQIDMANQLCLSLVGSRTEANRRAATSLPFEAIRRAMLDSPAAMKIVILDCCFAGLASLPANSLGASSDDVLDRTAGSGAYTMAASAAYSPAWYDTAPGAVRPQTFFTQYLVDLVESGIAGQPSGLRLHPLFVHLRDRLASDKRPVPVERSVDAAHDFVFAHNAAPPEVQRDLDREITELSQRLAEAEARSAAAEAAKDQARLLAEARELALRAEIAERTRELERLQEQARSRPAMPAEAREELDEAIDEAQRLLDETTAAHEVATTGAGTPEQTALQVPQAEVPPEAEALTEKADSPSVPLLARRQVLGGIVGITAVGGLVGWGLDQLLVNGNGGKNPNSGVSSRPAGASHSSSPSTSRSSSEPITAQSPSPTQTSPPQAPGTLLWNIHSPGQMVNNVVALAGTVYTADDNANGGPDSHNVYAFNASNGHVIWRAVNYAEFYDGPVVSNGMVYFGSDFHTVTALSAKGGRGVWQYTAGDFITSPPAVTSEAVYFSSYDKYIYSVHATQGGLIWKIKMPGTSVLFIAVGGAYVYMASESGTVAIRASDGGTAWQSPVTSSVLTIAGDALIVGRNGTLYSLDTKTGTQIWSYNVGGTLSSIAVSGGVVYTGCGDGRVRAVNITSGTLKWSFRAGGAVNSGIAVANGTVFFGCDDYKVYAVDTAAGKQKWAYKTRGAVESGLAVYDSKVFAGSNDGSLYALQA